ncbi:hypothetical protein NL676_032523 [Syzygium grande]|nr:hypothetical protein NL676_032523 [Syzygium grande]
MHRKLPARLNFGGNLRSPSSICSLKPVCGPNTVQVAFNLSLSKSSGTPPAPKRNMDQVLPTPMETRKLGDGSTSTITQLIKGGGDVAAGLGLYGGGGVGGRRRWERSRRRGLRPMDRSSSSRRGASPRALTSSSPRPPSIFVHRRDVLDRSELTRRRYQNLKQGRGHGHVLYGHRLGATTSSLILLLLLLLLLRCRLFLTPSSLCSRRFSRGGGVCVWLDSRESPAAPPVLIPRRYGRGQRARFSPPLPGVRVFLRQVYCTFTGGLLH